MNEVSISTAILRKLIFAIMVVGGMIIFDKFYLKGFDTWEVLKDDPKAISMLLGSFIIALAFA